MQNYLKWLSVIAAELVLAGAPTVMGDMISETVSAAMFWSGVGLLVITLFLWAYKEKPFLGFLGKLSISKASALMYNRANEKSRELARMGSTIAEYNTPDRFFILILKAYAEMDQICLWGRRGSGLDLEKLPRDDLRGGAVIREDSMFSSTLGNEKRLWMDLQVSRSDVKIALKAYQDENRQRIA